MHVANQTSLIIGQFQLGVGLVASSAFVVAIVGSAVVVRQSGRSVGFPSMSHLS